MRVVISLFVLGLISYSVTSPVSPNAIPAVQFRLTKNVVPSAYQLNIRLSTIAFDTKRFSGDVTITLHIENATKEIRLHSLDIEIIDFQLTMTGDENVLTGHLSQPEIASQTRTFTSDEDLKGNYTLKIDYIAPLIDDDMYGFYQSTYTDESGNTKYLASTQFESMSARKAFPCFDEPEFKATFQISITAPKSFGLVVSNTKLNNKDTDTDPVYTKWNFLETPPMSTYLVAFIVSEFDTSPSPINPDFHVVARPGTQTNVVIDQGPQLLSKLSDYTGITYESFGLGKMDVAAIPDFAAGAMENWGLVTFREILLVDDGDDTSALIKQRIATTIAHEFAHSWFGDYVTLDWWSDTWLNEGFATFFEFYITNLVNDNYHLNEQYLTNEKQPIMITDGLSSADPLSSKEEDINTPTEADNKFSLISYDKGGSIIIMMNHFVTEDVFKDGLNKYLNARKLQNGSPESLFNSIDEAITAAKATVLPANTKMGDVMNEWVYSSGYPVVNVSLNGDTVTISQQRFLYDTDNTGSDTKWFVPINYITKSAQTETTEWLLKDKNLELKTKLKENDWILINNEGYGYYRVNYDDVLWDRIISAVKDTNEKIVNRNKAQVIDDIFNLARVGQVGYDKAFALSDYLSKETDYFAWTAAFNAYGYLIKRTGSSTLGKAVSAKLLSLVSPLYDNNKPDKLKDEHIEILNQAQALKWACNLGHEDCMTFAKTSFTNYKKDGKTIPNTNFRSVVYCTALRNSNDSTDWDFLWNRFLNTTSSAEQNIILTALGCSRDENILDDYLNKSINPDSGIRRQDADTAFKAVYNGNPENVDIAYQFLKDHHQAIADYYKGMSSLSTIISGIADAFTTQEQVDDLNKFLQTDGLSDDFKIVGKQASEAASINVKWLQKFQSDLDSIFDINGTGTADRIRQMGLTLFLVTVLVPLITFNL